MVPAVPARRLTLGAALAAALAALAAPACHDRAEAVQADAALRDMVRQTMPAVARAAGLAFKREPAVARRTRAEVRRYLIHKLDEELPPPVLRGVTAAYQRFGLLPDSIDLRQVMINVLTEQVAGYYDPDSGTLFVPVDEDTVQLRAVVIPHELVHALQDQYMPIDSLLHVRRQNDRRTAADAVLEGQATLAQTRVLMPELPVERLPNFLDSRRIIREQQSQFPNFARAPMWVRETLIFPYLAGADFVRWFVLHHPGLEPYGARLPTSTAQILHPELYAAGVAPLELRFAKPYPDTLLYEDDLGEFEIRLLFTQLLGAGGTADAPGTPDAYDDSVADALADGWAGDRYAVFGRDGAALVWYTAWRDAAAAARFRAGLERAWARRAAPGRRAAITAVTVDGHPGVRLVDAPATWAGWSRIPAVRPG